MSAEIASKSNVIQLQDESELREPLEVKGQAAGALSKPSPVVVIYFWADWAEQCKQVDSVIDDLAKKYTKTQFFKVEAEKFEDISEAYEISAVPTVILAQKAKIVGRVDGANVAEIVKMVAAACAAANGIKSEPASAAMPAEFKQDLNTRLKGLIERAPVMVFIKGTAAQPRCGFSKKIVGMLNEQNIKYGYFDILTDEQVRQGLKEYSDWPTFPQLYISGELVGGVDIVSEMIESGDLIGMIPEEAVAK
ncbi:glutaredoxin [Coemansia sp. RSA 1694]|nr:glutaredoxin [Coemansia sp. RSA 25]KAJ2505929.1 glutaredoxin [Coemansia sp. RSA 2052]KAJ2618624.1 glutaredoxin [Coemansia sp. RSA 1694]